MKHVGLRISTPKEKQVVRKRRRRTLALGLFLIAILAMGWWQISAAAENRGTTLVPAALLDVASLEPRTVREASHGVTVAVYEARRQEYAEREPERPFGTSAVSAGHELGAQDALSAGERADVLAAPLVP